MSFLFFKPDRYFTVLNASNTIHGNEVDNGFNNMINAVDMNGNKVHLCFVDIKNIFLLLDRGPCYREVFITEETPIIHEERCNIKGENVTLYHADTFELGDIKIWTGKDIVNLINMGADISVGDYYIVKWSLMYNFEVFFFLQEYITAQDEDLWGRIINNLYKIGML